jgi:hypothetical protein
VGPPYSELRSYVLRSTEPDDVVLSTNELSFALSALTGRKVLVTRRAQNDAFVDMDVRNRDAALILYGRDSALRRRLLERWQVKYLLWTADWIPNEYGSTADGRLTYEDPLLFFYDPAYEGELNRAGVVTRTEEGWVDPALRGEDYQKFPLTFVMPGNYERPDHPWRDDLDSLLTEVWSFRQEGRKVAALYRVRL